MNLHVSDAIILHHHNYGESDRIVTFLSPEEGICKGFARNARASRKRFGPALEPFSSCRMHYSTAKSGELLSLREAELIDLRVGLRRDLQSLALAAYGCEVVEALGGGHGHPEIFALLAAYLDHLAGAGATPEARLLLEIRLLFHSGYAPHLLHCAECFGPLPATFSFSAELGGSLCPDCAPPGLMTVSLGTIGTLNRLARTPIEAFSGFHFGERTLNEGGRILSDALRQHLTRPLKSLTFLEAVQPADL
ncbi:MAG: DNA repair protein RecO [Desulfuromonadales bacterium]|nr:DNA repair protein RecO [Desulfuromonadales bacterium]